MSAKETSPPLNEDHTLPDSDKELPEAQLPKDEATENSDHRTDLEMSPEEYRYILRKLDWAIIPYCSLLYLLSFLDRVNIGQAAVVGLKTDLNISKGNAYAIALSVFFVGYIIVEVPSNLILKAVKPHRWIPMIMIAWGITMTLMGLVQSGGGLQAARFFLGVAEGGLFPGINFMLTCWYARRHQSFRIGIFFSGATLAGAFGGVLAYGLKYIPFPSWQHFGDIPQKAVPQPGGWRWIFIIEGLITFLCAIPGWWLLVDFPADDNKILTHSETAKWNHFLAKSQGVTNANVPFSWDQIRQSFADYRMYLYAVLYISIAEPLYSLALFTPTIIADLDFSGASANLLSVPPYVLGFITTMTTAFLADRFIMRGPFILFWACFVIIGYAILISDVSSGVKYFAIFLTVAGVSPNIALAISWVGANFGPIYVRATVMGFFFTIGNSAGLISSNIYPTTESPRFIKGHAINLGFAGLTFILTSLIMFINWRHNKARDAISYAHPDGRDVDPARLAHDDEKARWGYEGYSHEELLRLGDQHRGFRYVL
ncbi:uncharacterized protein PV06_10344 [Exophiala oligosperma]|uniref:Major facilitator superfamily (MFS) profile domain-containing protein n=1 Tax=Exophiala oligosperma TaxID=215243 RepID=A0A0D2D327_9EURO|nr:uncharacterized protein PV06_10344 [Exophiala oligosperma]KIW37713.1 hypothetical protein PV06_10344 [Exophiala oligosperma]